MVAVRIIPRDTVPRQTMTAVEQAAWTAALAGEPALEKRCSGCKQLRPHSAYSADRSRKDGLQRYCKACKSARGAVAATPITEPPSRPDTAPRDDGTHARGETTHVCLGCGESEPAVKFRRYPSGVVASACTTCISAKQTATYRENRARQTGRASTATPAPAAVPADDPLIFRAYLLPIPEPRPRAIPHRTPLRVRLRRVVRAALAEWRR